MPRFGPSSRRDLIRYFRQLGFVGPIPGGCHQFLVKGELRVPIPNPHQGDISVGLLNRILQQAGISRDEWENL
jgi:predicted RNA binding protein YcfA (HicA-like mRNA interferase family)